jgi:tRNA 2-thiouridine synthesizing protein A
MLELDTCGLGCPLPVLKAAKVLSAMNKDDVLRLISTDAGSCGDVPAFVKTTKNELLSQETDGGKFIFLIRKT